MMMITDEKKYQQLILKEPLKSVEFLVHTMGFDPMPANHEQEVFIHDKLGNYFKLLLNPCTNCQGPVLIYTNDCLSNYFDLKTSGVHFVNGPQYTPQGLMVEFTDNWGNCYKILEERFYEDDQ
jgi:hypothetical protein